MQVLPGCPESIPATCRMRHLVGGFLSRDAIQWSYATSPLPVGQQGVTLTLSNQRTLKCRGPADRIIGREMSPAPRIDSALISLGLVDDVAERLVPDEPTEVVEGDLHAVAGDGGGRRAVVRRDDHVRQIPERRFGRQWFGPVGVQPGPGDLPTAQRVKQRVEQRVEQRVA